MTAFAFNERSVALYRDWELVEVLATSVANLHPPQPELRALVDKDNEGLLLQDLSLHYPNDGWTMTAPTHVSWGNNRTVVDPVLTLTSGPQQLSLALKMEGQRIAADGVQVYNPAFDVTPAELITGIVTERGVV